MRAGTSIKKADKKRHLSGARRETTWLGEEEVKVELLYIRDCPNHVPAIEAVKDVLRESGLPPDIVQIEISSLAQAVTLSFPGSPTVRVDGKDVEPGVCDIKHFGVSCRSYLVNGKRQGVPDREWIRESVRPTRTKS
jgi:hypothetical protein